MAKKFLLPVLAVSLLCNIVALVWYSSTEGKSAAAPLSFDQAEKKYPLLSKRVLQEYPQDILINFYNLRTDLRQITEPYGESFGLYFEYLPTGTSVSINATDEFYAASLFKVPVIMAYYHGKERTKNTDDPYIEVKPEHIDKEYGELWKKGPGTKLRASEAIRLAIIESDNTAIKALLPHIMQEDFKSVYDGIDLELHADNNGALVSARTYSTVLKALYYSSLLSKENSQHILSLLAQTKFNDKLVAGVPQDVAVAHKIGDFKSDKDQGFRDCGIVYATRRPYVLCMFSVGDEQMAKERMQQVSKKVYEFVTTSKK